MNPEHGAGRDPINVINDPLFTYTRARIPVYPPEKKLAATGPKMETMPATIAPPTLPSSTYL